MRLRGKPCVLASGTPDGPEERRFPWTLPCSSLGCTARACGRTALESGAVAPWKHSQEQTLRPSRRRCERQERGSGCSTEEPPFEESKT